MSIVEEISCQQLSVLQTSDPMSIDVAVLSTDASIVDLYEPMRKCALDKPPKRFYRRFWRSVAQRLLRNQKT